MKKIHITMMNKLNLILEKHNQLTRVSFLTATSITLTTGQIFTNVDRRKFVRRIVHKKTTLWVENTDNILNGIISPDDIKRTFLSDAGKKAQQIHGRNIRNNLNTGIPWNKGLTGLPGRPLTSETKLKISIANSGEKNGMYGVKMTDEKKKEKSAMMQQLILTGKFTPNSNNRNTHWDAELDGKKYRSSWEALYQYINPSAQYEDFRIEYQHNNMTKIYIVDFIDNEQKLLIEVKPKEFCNGDIFNAKMYSLKKWADENLYTILLVDQYWLVNNCANIDYERFDKKTEKKIKRFYEISKKKRN